MDPDAQTFTAILIDPQPLWLDALERVLAAVPVTTVGKASTPQDARVLIGQLRPDLAIGDPGGEGQPASLAWLRDIAEKHGTKVIVLTTCSSPDYVESVLDAGAFACVLKTAHPEDLASTVRQTIRKSVYLSRAPTRKTAPPLPVAALPLPDMLTRRELEILRLVAEGHSNAKLANMLWVTEQTVKFHLSNIYRKIDVANRTEAGRWAQLHGVLSGSLPSSTHVA